jgi:hypothetical protein
MSPHQPDPGTCPVHATIDERLTSAHAKLDLLIAAVCGDLSAKDPGLAERLRALELKVRCILGAIVALFSCMASLLAFIGAAKIVSALRVLFTS